MVFAAQDAGSTRTDHGRRGLGHRIVPGLVGAHSVGWRWRPMVTHSCHQVASLRPAVRPHLHAILSTTRSTATGSPSRAPFDTAGGLVDDGSGACGRSAARGGQFHRLGAAVSRVRLTLHRTLPFEIVGHQREVGLASALRFAQVALGLRSDGETAHHQHPSNSGAGRRRRRSCAPGPAQAGTSRLARRSSCGTQLPIRPALLERSASRRSHWRQCAGRGPLLRTGKRAIRSAVP